MPDESHSVRTPNALAIQQFLLSRARCRLSVSRLWVELRQTPLQERLETFQIVPSLGLSDQQEFLFS